MTEKENTELEKPSKTERKLAMLDLQKIGETLMRLPKSQFEKIPLPDNLREAIVFVQTLHTHESIRRQLQYIGKLMRKIDVEPIKLALQDLQFQHEQHTNTFHEIEKWRDRLIAENDETLQQFLKMYPETDRQQLRQIIRKAQHDMKHEKNTGGKTTLFKYLREIIQK